MIIERKYDDEGDLVLTIQTDAATDSLQLIEILEEVLPQALTLFARKNREYGGAENELGPKAQFVDMNRKFKKVKLALWDDAPLTSEPLYEVLQDFVGHIFLTLNMLRKR